MAGVDLAGLAAALEKAAQELNTNAAREAAQACGEKFLAKLQENTPVKSGALRDSEDVTVSGGGTEATATISTHRPEYASFREHGGMIHIRDKRVLSDGNSFFGKAVLQSGSFYMGRTVRWAESGVLDDTVREIVQRIIRDSGL